VRSLTTLRGSVAQGVFIDRATLTTGGLRASLGVRASTLAWLTLGWIMGLLAIAQALRGGGDGDIGTRLTRRGLFAAAIVALALAAAIVFRAELLAHAAAVACACATVSASIAVSTALARASASRTRSRWPLLAFALGSLAAIVLLLPEAFLHGRVLSQADMLYDGLPWRAHLPQDYRPVEHPPLGDVPMLVYPFTTFAAAQLRSGHFPLWTASMASGQPFLATYQSAVLAPFTWIAAVVPLPRATVVIAAARLFVGGVGMFVFLRRIGLSTWASAFGGVSYLLNPFSLVWLEHPLAGVPPWWPWMAVSVEAVVTAMTMRAIAALAITTALTLLGGHPHTGLFVAGFGAAYAVMRAATTSPARWRALAAVCLALALGGLLAAVQILPFLEYLSLSRAATLRSGYTLNPFIAPLSTLITTIVPNFLGHPILGNYAGPLNYLEQQSYPGAATWMLAPIGLITGLRRWRPWFFAIAAILAMLGLYGAPGLLQLISVLPLIKAATLTRLSIIAITALIVLAACGADAILDASTSGTRIAIAAAAVTLITAGLLLGAAAWSIASRRPELDAHALLDFATQWTSVAACLMLAVALLVIARLFDVMRPAAAGIALVAVATLDLLLVGRGFHPMLPPEQVFPRTPEIDRVQQDHDIFRVLGLGNALLPNSATIYGLQDIRGYDGLAVARYADLLDIVLTYEPETHVHVAHRLNALRLLDMLNVKYVVAPSEATPPDGWSIAAREGAGAVWRNEHVYPRAWLVDGYVVLDGNPARRALRDARVDTRRVAILEADPPTTDRPTAAPPAASLTELGRASITSYRDEVVEIETDTPDRRLLVLSDVHYPGWSARIDDHPAALYRANFAFRAVSVPAGRHHVVFAYQPASFRWGLTLTSIALVTLVALMAGERWRARWQGRERGRA